MSWGRRFAAVVLVWLVVVPVVVLGPGDQASAVEPESSAAVAVAGERLSGASSLAAGHIGLHLAFGDRPAICDLPAYENVGICKDGDTSPSATATPTPTPTPEPTATPAPDYGQLKADAYIDAIDDLNDSIPEPQMRLWPAVDKFQVVNLDSYLYVESGWATVSGEGEACDSWTPTECVTVSFDGEPEESLWSFVEANSLNPPVEFPCDRGERQPEDLDSEPLCGKTWTNSSDVTGDVTAEMSVQYKVTVTTSHAAYRPYLNTSFDIFSPEPDEETLRVVEVQTYGHSDIAPVSEESNDGLCSKWGISFICWVGEKAADAAIWALVNAVPGLEEVWNFFKGCGDGVLEELGGILTILETVKGAITDPGEFINEKLQAMKDLYEAATTDPDGFIVEVLGGVLDLEYLDEHGMAQWIGKTACSMAIQYLSGAGVARFTQKLDDFLGRRGKGRNAGSCTISSFPASTQVLMADGGYTRIDQIEPGDHVLSHNLDTSVWEPKLVVDQWSHLDRGPPATATLHDGSTTTATDDHLYWVPNTGQWTELQHVRPGDRFLTPDGETIVDHVTVGHAQDLTVWELTVQDHHNFTVHTGTTDLLVHNGSRCAHANDDGSVVYSNDDGSYDYTAPDGTEYSDVVIGEDGLPELDANGKPRPASPDTDTLRALLDDHAYTDHAHQFPIDRPPGVDLAESQRQFREYVSERVEAADYSGFRERDGTRWFYHEESNTIVFDGSTSTHRSPGSVYKPTPNPKVTPTQTTFTLPDGTVIPYPTP